MKRAAILTLAAAGLAGCAGFSDDAGLGPVKQAAQRHLGTDLAPPQRDARIAALLAAPLTMDGAVELALLNHRGLQAALHAVGVAEADFVEAGRLPNPVLSFARLVRGDEVELERGLHFDLARLLTRPIERQVRQRRFEQAQAGAAMQVLALAADTRRAWVQAVAAEESLRYAAQVARAAAAGAELAGRMAQVGNFNRLQLAREQGFSADAALGLARARLAQTATRERLVRLLGLWGEQLAFQLPERLPELPAAARELPDIERIALAQRLDVQAARLALAEAERAGGGVRLTRGLQTLELGLQHNGSNEAPTQRGWELAVELPLDGGGARSERAARVQAQAAERLAQAAIDARSEVREAYAAYRHAWDIARHQRDERVPLARRIGEENLLRYNGMLIGVFELLADARVQVATVHDAIGAQRDFWLAHADLEMALVGRPQLAAPAPASTAPATAPDGAH